MKNNKKNITSLRSFKMKEIRKSLYRSEGIFSKKFGYRDEEECKKDKKGINGEVVLIQGIGGVIYCDDDVCNDCDRYIDRYIRYFYEDDYSTRSLKPHDKVTFDTDNIGRKAINIKKKISV